MYAKGDGTDTIDGGVGVGWTDTIDMTGVQGYVPGGVGTDWTLNLTQGSVVSSDASSVILSQDADGTVTFGDGAVVTFQDMERIQWH